MKNICITKSNDKLNKNLPYYTEYFKAYEIDTAKNSIYKSYYSLGTNIDTFIFNLSKLTPEVISFINEFGEQKKCIIYIDTQDNQHAINNIKNCEYYIKSNIKLPNIEGTQVRSDLVNDVIYNHINIPDKKNQAIYFLDNDQYIPSELSTKLLYPKTKIQIKMFNGDNIKHYQHLGYLPEHTRKNILLESTILIYTNNDYINEATMCGCKSIHLDRAQNCSTIEELSSLAESNTTHNNIIPYSQFIKDFLL